MGNIENRCYKFRLPSGQTVDLLSNIPAVIEMYLQKNSLTPESCGYILGYKNSTTGNITLNCVSTPKDQDIRMRCFCTLRDIMHRAFLSVQQKEQNYYMGTWHTHPQISPVPSSIDIDEWDKTLKYDKTGCEFAFFIIAGTSDFSLWAGDYKSRRIVKLVECTMCDGLYEDNLR